MTQSEFGEYVKGVLDNRGVRYSHVAKQLGMSRQKFAVRLDGRGWTIDEVSAIIKILDLPKDILCN